MNKEQKLYEALKKNIAIDNLINKYLFKENITKLKKVKVLLKGIKNG